jgi:two-component system, OmpR family, phosphate regulon sensor histidine kinase PhoR
MFSLRLFWKLLLTCAGLNAIAAVIGGLIVSHWLRDTVTDQAPAEHWVWALVIVEFICVTSLSCWIIGRIIRPVATLNEAAKALATGDYQHHAYVPNRDELGTLAAALNRLSEGLDLRMSQLSQTADRQSTVLEGMIEGVIAVDERQRIVLANEAAGRVFEFRPTASAGRPLLEVARNHALHAAVTAALATGELQRLETRRVGVQTLSMNIHVQPLPGRPCPGVVLVIHDTTELRRLEAIRRDFVANVSHELKTPLSSIKAYTETLRGGALRDLETADRFLGQIEEQAERLNRLIVDMLMLARIESDNQAFEIVSVDVPEIVRASLEDHRRAADAKRITLTVGTDGKPVDNSAPCRVRADREGLREILDNLLDNAIKYTPESGNVMISWCCNQPGAQHPASGIQHPSARITVRDTGIGIKPADRERIFERFYRVDKARSRELGGTGLGLSIVKHLVQAFGGKVIVESEPGKGSTFTVELPVG